LLKGVLALFAPDAILTVHLPIILRSFLTPILDLVFEVPRARICVYIGVSCLRGVRPDLFLVDFRRCFRPYFTGLENPSIHSAVQKFLGRYFAHRKYEPLSRTSAADRKVNKTRKTRIEWPPDTPLSAPVLAILWRVGAAYGD
jgi:hypothetical protein